MQSFASRFVGMLALSALLFALPARAENADSFYRGKTIFIDVGSAPGGAFDAYARLIARHYGQFLPGSPAVAIRNMPGAASMLAAEHVYKMSPKDGTELGLMLNTVPVTQLMQPGKFSTKPEEFVWIGTVASPSNVLAVWYTADVRSVNDAKTKPISIGSTTPGTTKDIVPRIANTLLGTKFVVVNGYAGGADVDLAMERGEVQGDGSNSWVTYTSQKGDWVRDKKIIPLFQVAFARDAGLADVPTLLELSTTERQQQVASIITTTFAIGLPVVAPPDLPPDRTEVLRRAFDAMTKDPDFLADAKKADLEVAPSSGEKLQDMVAAMMASPPEAIAEFKQAVSASN